MDYRKTIQASWFALQTQQYLGQFLHDLICNEHGNFHERYSPKCRSKVLSIKYDIILNPAPIWFTKSSLKKEINKYLKTHLVWTMLQRPSTPSQLEVIARHLQHISLLQASQVLDCPSKNGSNPTPGQSCTMGQYKTLKLNVKKCSK